MYAKRNIQLCAVHPGYCRTELGGEDAPLSAAEGASSFVWSITTSKNINNKFHHVGVEMSWTGEDN